VRQPLQRQQGCVPFSVCPFSRSFSMLSTTFYWFSPSFPSIRCPQPMNIDQLRLCVQIPVLRCRAGRVPRGWTRRNSQRNGSCSVRNSVSVGYSGRVRAHVADSFSVRYHARFIACFGPNSLIIVARCLLSWNKEQVFDKYYANPTAVQKEAGVRNRFSWDSWAFITRSPPCRLSTWAAAVTHTVPSIVWCV
jgi:hypothetical protein